MGTKHPKGLITASLTNMGERFGFYIMMAILLLFLQAKFGISSTTASAIYSVFYGLVYILALVGGIIADRLKNYKGTILVGLIIMTLGYVVMAMPTSNATAGNGTNMTPLLILICGGLLLISFGNGLFKGNLQALVGRMYDNDEYRAKRDSGFSLFYMFINIGAVFAPLIAVGIRNWWLLRSGFHYDAKLPELCHAVLNNTATTENLTTFNELATAATANGSAVTDPVAFAETYIGVFNTGFHYAFAAAIVAMVISLVVYLTNKKNFPKDDRELSVAAKAQISQEEIKMSAAEIKQRIMALFAVFGVVIFFWVSFHQNGVTLTQFAKDYVDLSKISLNLGFTKIEGAEIFQSINPLFVVLLTPLILWLFSFLNKRGKEPSVPRKIVIGMFIAACGFIVMAIGSRVMPMQKAMEAGETFTKASPWLLVFTYMLLTVAELFISPMGISFVSKVAPPHLRGIMQGLWLCTTAAANFMLVIGMVMYNNIPIWATWVVFAGACLLSMFIMLSLVKWLERVAK